MAWPGDAAQRQQQRVRIDADDGGRGQPVKQPDGQRSRPAAKVEHKRIRDPGAVFHRVDQGGEPLLPVRQVPKLLGIPAGDPVKCCPAIKPWHEWPPWH